MTKDKMSPRILMIISSIVIIVLLIFSQSISENVYAPYTTHSASPDGAKAIMLLLKQEGVGVSELVTAVPEKEGLMILIEPSEQHVDESDWQQILSWVEKGNTLLLASDNGKDLYKELGYELVKIGHSKPEMVFSNSPLLADVRQINVKGRTRIKQHNTMTFADGDDAGIYLAEISRGKGRIVFLTDPSILSNKEINQGDNLILFLNIVRLYGQRDIWFNEYSHGYTLKRASREVFTWPVRFVVIQLFIGIMLLYYYWGKRFGKSIPLSQNADRISGDYVSSMANIYRQSRARKMILENIYEDFKRSAARYLGVSPQISDEELVRILSGRPHIDTESLKKLLDRCRVLVKSPSFSENALLSVVRDFGEWQRSNLHHYMQSNLVICQARKNKEL